MSCYDFNPESLLMEDDDVNVTQPISDKVLKYEEFVNEVLKNDLNHVLEERDKIYDEVAEYMKLQTSIERLKTIDSRPIKEMIDVGCNFYMQAEVKNTDYIYVDVGMGLHVQLTFDEALRFLKKKIDQLTVKSEHLTEKSVDIKARIKLIIGALAELQGVSAQSSKPRYDPFS
ncbi:protein UXT-like isoform X3 [Bolinopsis microptera]|uniref:protein UXT-like isoform X3 n=1 Tax=Bolinopsis microptera TaxID=2820187 RepID=UPI00307A084A